MKSSLIDITGKLPAGLVELYLSIALRADAMEIKFLVVGAMARDLVLVHGFGSKIERGTRDVDFAINVSSWEEFDSLKNQLLEFGYQEDKKLKHKLHYKCSEGMAWEIDIIPFGAIEDDESTIAWPPNQDFEMNMLGFKEAAENALIVRINKDPEIEVRVASPAGMSVLKLISWMDRDPNKRKKDAFDLRYLIETYTKIPEIYDAVFEEKQMERQDFDEARASAMKLGLDASKIASKKTKSFLTEKLFNDTEKLETLIREMAGKNYTTLSECQNWLAIYREEFTKQTIFLVKSNRTPF